jgi:uncharacterized protein YkwD
MTAWRFFPVALVALVAAGCTVPIASAPAPTSAPSRARRTSPESRIFDLINSERVHQGLPALVYNEQLDRMAKIQAENMAHYQKMAHVIPEADLPTLPDRARYVSYQFGRLAENVALGYPSAETVVQGWMTSKGHRANILNDELVETGIGIARSSSGGLYYCQVFGRRLTAPANPL